MIQTFEWHNDPLSKLCACVQYIPRNMHTVFALLCFVVVIHWLIFPYPPGLLRWHCGNLTIAPVPAKQPWWIWINTSCEIIMNDYITTTQQSTTKPCAYLLGYTVYYGTDWRLSTQQGRRSELSIKLGLHRDWSVALWLSHRCRVDRSLPFKYCIYFDCRCTLGTNAL